MFARTLLYAFALLIASMIAIPLAAQSSGSCFDCTFNDNPEPPMHTDWDCLTTSSGDYGSCSERITSYDKDGNATADDCVTYDATYCPADGDGGGGGGGGGDTGGGGTDDQTDECSTGGWGGCPAQCANCF